MKKIVISFSLISMLIFCFLIGQEKKAEKTKKDIPKNFVKVEKVQPVSENVKKGFESINGTDAMHYLKFLSSDALGGRDTGMNSYKIAAEYVASMFALWGIKPAGGMPSSVPRHGYMPPQPTAGKKSTRSFMQEIQMKETLSSEGSAKVEWRSGGLYKAKMFTQNVDYQYSALDSQVLTAPVVFVGYGISEKSINFDEYKNVNVKGKIVMMLSENPRKGDSESFFAKNEIKNKYDPPRMMRMSRFMRSEKEKLAQKRGAIAIIMVENSPEKKGDVAKKILDSQMINDEKPIFPGKRRMITLIDSSNMMPFKKLPTISVSRQMADEILKLADQSIESLKKKIEKDLKPHSMELSGVTFTVKNNVKNKLIKCTNVLGYIEGSDPELKKEVIVIGAHLDHLGKRGDYIFNGADDNGSGSVAVMEMAQAFALNPVKPKRSILFALWTGEEKGLLGSRYYVSHPFFPLEKTVINLNLDMVSREWNKNRLKMMAQFFKVGIDDATLKKIDVSNFMSLYFDGKGIDLRSIMLENNKYVGLTMFLRESKGQTMGAGGSDHAPFNMVKIPWIFFAAGMTEDFHQPSDTFEKVSKKLMQNITRLCYLIAFSLANK